ncbi:hypothetical protein AURDEDRAFT_187716 [Auricularia subglabra TFB-10046 SS5]|nr:hypothetical protein AURDEDRAFT_187716 [Auricularia subglabra TFB-10046 SS5]
MSPATSATRIIGGAGDERSRGHQKLQSSSVEELRDSDPGVYAITICEHEFVGRHAAGVGKREVAGCQVQFGAGGGVRVSTRAFWLATTTSNGHRPGADRGVTLAVQRRRRHCTHSPALGATGPAFVSIVGCTCVFAATVVALDTHPLSLPVVLRAQARVSAAHRPFGSAVALAHLPSRPAKRTCSVWRRRWQTLDIGLDAASYVPRSLHVPVPERRFFSFAPPPTAQPTCARRQHLPVGPAPRSLSRLTLRAGFWDTLDYRAFCDTLDAVPDNMSLFGCGDYDAALSLWSRRVGRPYSMDWQYDPSSGGGPGPEYSYYLITLAARGLTLVFDSREPNSAARARTMVPYLRGLATLTCGTEHLHQLLVPQSELLALAELTLVLRSETLDPRFADEGSLRAPCLQTLCIDGSQLQ